MGFKTIAVYYKGYTIDAPVPSAMKSKLGWRRFKGRLYRQMERGMGRSPTTSEQKELREIILQGVDTMAYRSGYNPRLAVREGDLQKGIEVTRRKDTGEIVSVLPVDPARRQAVQAGLSWTPKQPKITAKPTKKISQIQRIKPKAEATELKTEQPKGLVDQLKEKYEGAEAWARQYSYKLLPTEQQFESFLRGRGQAFPSVWQSTLTPSAFQLISVKHEAKMFGADDPFTKEAQQYAITEYMIGMERGFREKPIKTTAMFAIGFLAPVGSKVLGTATAGLPATAQTLIGAGEIGGSLALGTLYLGTTAEKIRTSDKPLRMAGEVTATEAVPLVTGGYLGSIATTKAEGIIRTWGRQEIPTRKLVPKDVLSGRRTFPEAPRKTHYQLFMKKSQRLPSQKDPMMYHQTGSQFWQSKVGAKFKTVKGSSEFEGLYGAHGVSPHFLRITPKKYTVYSTKFVDTTKSGILVVKPTKFVKGTTAKTGQAFVPAIKTEVEAIVPPASIGKITGTKFYTTWEGVRVPIDTATMVAGKTTISQTIPAVAPSSSYVASSTSLVSPLALTPSLARSPSSVIEKSVPFSQQVPSGRQPTSQLSPLLVTRIITAPPSPRKYTSPKVTTPYSPVTPKVPTITEPVRERRRREELLFLERRTKRKPQLKRQPKKYRPSLIAVGYGIRGRRPKILTGAEIRPIISRRKIL